MKVRFACTACGKGYEVDDMLAGKRTKCRECGVAMRVPHPAIELGPADGPTPLPLPAEPIAYATAIPAVAQPLLPEAKPGGKSKARPKSKKFDPSPRGPRKIPAWVGQAIAFLLGCTTSGAVFMLMNAAHPPVARVVERPEVAIRVRFENGRPPDEEETTRAVIATVTKELAPRGIAVNPLSKVVAVALIQKQKKGIDLQLVSDRASATGPAASSAPAATAEAPFHEDLLDISLVFDDAAGQPFWTQAQLANPKPGLEKGINLHPEKLPRPNGMTMEQALILAQWSEAATRFEELAYPDSHMVNDAEAAEIKK